MRARAMHPLCCISIDCPRVGDRSPAPAEPEPELYGVVEGEASSSAVAVAVAGVLYKWINFGKGWRSRWFSLRNGVLSYSKIPQGEEVSFSEGEGVRLIGTAASRLSRANVSCGGRNPPKPVGVVYLKISSFRVSKTDERRFYIFSPTKTLQLRTDSQKDRVAWIEALISARSKFSVDGRISYIQNDISISTKKLRDRMHVEGLDDVLIKDCEQIMLSEFSEFQRQLKLRYEEHLSFLRTFQQQLEDVNADEVTTTIHEGQLHLLKHEYSCSGHGNNSEYSTTESSDDVEKQELDELSDEGEPHFFDTKESFSDSTVVCASKIRDLDHADKSCCTENCLDTVEMMDLETEPNDRNAFLYIRRRTKLPDPIEKEKGVSLWSMLKDNVGKDLTRVCLPVYFNEPLSTLQKCFEDLEYSYLLDRAYEYGKMGNSLMRILHVAAFAISGYASSDGRHCKPFNPLLGETYEADFPEKGIRFFSEKVQGFIVDVNGTKVATLMGKWDDSMYYTIDDFSKTRGCISTQDSTLLWKRSKPPPNPTRYNLSSFAITLNELTPEFQIKEKLPPTDSRLRPDQRYLENGEYEKANAEKQRLERRQRMSRKLQENGWKPRWFWKDSKDGTFRYTGGYWEAREQKKWDNSPDIFGEFSEDQNVPPSN
uniref:Oxysterol-binding protein-related protein 2A isoform X6 n=1 Tax=Elaeis guineensis var. tenera TaxID=51953 RepID=A0A8N4F1Y6_ELAGV|nr:oxysterol-binding protein-related protein 2A isoform X6 [Elaeis guineensis]